MVGRPSFIYLHEGREHPRVRSRADVDWHGSVMPTIALKQSAYLMHRGGLAWFVI